MTERRALSLTLVALPALALLTCSANLARAQTTSASTPSTESDAALEAARTHFKIGVDFYRERNFRAALIEFERAYKASPHYKLLYNLGQASLELQEDPAAIEYFTRYLREGGDDITPERKAEVESDIARLQARLGSVTITSNQAGAEIRIDDTLVGTTPIADALKVSVGRRRIVASKAGFDDEVRVIEVAAGDHISVHLDFKAKPQLDLAKLRLETNEPEASSSMSAAAWAGIATGVLAAGAGTFTVLTLLAQNSYDDEKKGETSAGKLQDIRDDAKTKALLADVLWGATIVSAGITTVLLFTSGGSEREPRKQPDSHVALGIGPTSLRLSGQF